MKRHYPAIGLLALAAALFLQSCGSTSAGVDVSSAPPPPAVSFATEPQWTYLSDRDVYVVQDDSYGYDMFRSGTYYYMYGDGHWYRATSYNGPYVAIQDRRVPRRIFDVNDRQYRWRRHPHGWRGR